MQPGTLRRAIRQACSLQHARAHAHTEEHTHAHTQTQTRACTRGCTHSRVHTHTRTLMCAHRHTDTQKQIHTHKRAAPALAQMRAEAGANKCTRGCAAVLAQTWAGARATSACASACRDVARRFEGTTDRVPGDYSEYLREYSRAPAADTMRSTRKRHTHTRTRAPARASGNGPLQSGVSGNGCPNHTPPRGRPALAGGGTGCSRFARACRAANG
jgi:hypothetical protein